MTLLTAEDVLNKKFQPTKFREGYDQDEVDDFLDDVVSTLRALTSENEQLRSNLAAAQARIAELGGDGGAGRRPVAEPEPEVLDEPEVMDEAEPLVEAEPVEAEESEPVEAEESEPVVPEPTSEAMPATTTAAETVPAPAADQGPQSAAGMLALAQRVHDEYVANGQRESERLLTEARSRADSLVQEAEEQRTQTLDRLEQERTDLERKIDELREFERDYRSRLKTYLEGLLQDVEGTTVPDSSRTIV